MNKNLFFYQLKKILFLTFFFAFVFLAKIWAGQDSFPPSPSQCQAQNWYIGLPDRMVCKSNLTVDLPQITSFLNDARIYPDLASANQFCKQYTNDSTAYAVSASVHNYCNGCDQYLAKWTGSRWNYYQVCAGTLNIQKITCAIQCKENVQPPTVVTKPVVNTY